MGTFSHFPGPGNSQARIHNKLSGLPEIAPIYFGWLYSSKVCSTLRRARGVAWILLLSFRSRFQQRLLRMVWDVRGSGTMMDRSSIWMALKSRLFLPARILPLPVWILFRAASGTFGLAGIQGWFCSMKAG